jgi:phasin
MNVSGTDRFEIPKEMRSMAEASFEQARKAFENFVAGAQQTAARIEDQGATVRAGARDIGAKAISYAENNVAAALDYAEQLLHAKDVAEVMRLHSEFVQNQMRALAEQAQRNGPDGQPRRDRSGKTQTLTNRFHRLNFSVPRPERASGRGLPCGIAPQIALRCTKLPC